MGYDKAGNIISITSLLKKRNDTDIWVYLGKNNKVPVRLVMIPLPALVATERIRKARQHPDKRFNHRDEYYKCLQFGIFITPVDKGTWTAQEVAKVYRLRWQIQISYSSGFVA